MAYIWVTGFESGVVSASGAGLFDGLTGAPTCDGTTKRTGSYSFRAYTAANAAIRAQKTITGSPAVLNGRFYLRLGAAPSGTTNIFYSNPTGGSSGMRLTSARVLQAWAGAATADVATLELNTWYRIDFKLDVSANPWVTSVRVDGGAEVQATSASLAAATFALVYIGHSNSAGTADLYFDDLVLCSGGAEYPIGAGEVFGLRPASEGTHNAGTNYIEDKDGNDIDAVTHPANPLLDKSPMSDNATYIQQVAGGGGDGHYAEVGFDPIAAGHDVKAAMGVLSYFASDVSLCKGTTLIRDSNGQETKIYDDGDMSESSVFYKSALVAAPAGGWTLAHANALKGRVGFSTDATPNPRWVGLLLEVAVADGAAPEANKTLFFGTNS